MLVEENQGIELENLLACKKVVAESEVEKEFAAMDAFIKTNNLNQVGGIITAVHGMKEQEGKNMLSIEMMIPVEHAYKGDGEYFMKERFNLVHALYVRHKGDPANLMQAHSALAKYMKEQKKQPITPFYNIYVNKVNDVKDLIIDVLIGVNPSTL